MKKLDATYIPPASGVAQPRQLIVLLHGYGSSAKGVEFLAREWAKALPDAAFLLPNAPEPCDTRPGGFQWFGARASHPDPKVRLSQISQAVPALNALIDEHLQKIGLADKNLFIGGFSQGAMMSMYAAPRRQKPCGGVIAYSGMLIDAEGLKDAVIVKMPVLAIHGGRDSAVPPERLDDVRAGFEAAGFSVETHLNPKLGHVIERAGVERGAAFIQRHIAPQPPTPALKPKAPKP